MAVITGFSVTYTHGEKRFIKLKGRVGGAKSVPV